MLTMNIREISNQFMDDILIRHESDFCQYELSVDLFNDEPGISLHLKPEISFYETEMSPMSGLYIQLHCWNKKTQASKIEK